MSFVSSFLITALTFVNPQAFSYPNPSLSVGTPAVDPEIQQWFTAVDLDKSGKITPKELQRALVNGQGKNFNITVCELLVSMFSKETPGMVNITEFQYLYKFVNQWLTTFKSFDRDQSGVIDENEFSQAFKQMGFNFSDDFLKVLLAKFDKVEKKKISVDKFILICIQIQRFTDAFRVKDSEPAGVITINFEEFLTIALSCCA